MFKKLFIDSTVTAEYLVRGLAQQLCGADGLKSRHFGKCSYINNLSGIGRRAPGRRYAAGCASRRGRTCRRGLCLAHFLSLATCAIAAHRDHLSGIRRTISGVDRRLAGGRLRLGDGVFVILFEKTTPAPRCLQVKSEQN
jgi:hypothetical protein